MQLNPLTSHNTFYCVFVPEQKLSGQFNEVIVQFNNAGGDTGTQATLLANRIKLLKEKTIPRTDIKGTLIICPMLGKLVVQPLDTRRGTYIAAGTIYTADGITTAECGSKKIVVVAADENIVDGEVTPYLPYFNVNEGENS